MELCPNCSARLKAGAASVCPKCGKALSGSNKKSPGKYAKKKTKKKPKKQKRPKAKKDKTENIPEIMGEAVDDGYDGYYNDVLPPDTDRINEGMDKELIKNILVISLCAAVIILMCVALLYVL